MDDILSGYGLWELEKIKVYDLILKELMNKLDNSYE